MLESFLKNTATSVAQEMQRWLSEKSDYVKPLFESMRYSAYSGGKRLRPALVLITGEALGVDCQSLLQAACAIEMIHTYSLIHDDLPAMDNDDLRRGKPTNHKVFGEATAILAGDGLLTLAFQVISSSPLLDDRAVLLMSKELAEAAGPYGMVGGQMADMLEEGQPLDEKRIQFIHQHKTGALLRAAVRMPALAKGADLETLQHLTIYGESIGLAFQIMDDVLDVTGDTQTLGKTAGMDVKLEKATFPALYGLDDSMKMVHRLTDKAIESVNKAPMVKDPSLMIELANALSKRNY